MGSDHLYNTHFAQTLTTPAIISHHQMTPPPMDSRAQGTINMQELSCMAGLPPTSHPATPSQSPDGKTKKRKSWGQVLPEPKTNLPPRKRAKTEDEKEQRRIERVKRNRLAAHNSRERKRQEVEALQIEKDKVHDRLHAAERKIAQMAAELKAFRQKYPNEVVPQADIDTTSSSVEDVDSTFGSDTINPRATSFPSPVSMEDYDSVRGDSCQPETPAYSESAATDFDQTQYPAVSVDFGAALQSVGDVKPIGLGLHIHAAAPSDAGLSYSFQPQPTFDDNKHVESLFDFDQFPETTASPFGDSSDFFNSAIFDDATNPYGLSETFGARHFALQTDSGATPFVSDESLAAEV